MVSRLVELFTYNYLSGSLEITFHKIEKEFCLHAQSYWLDPLIKGNIFWARYDVSYKYRKMIIIVIENFWKKTLC